MSGGEARTGYARRLGQLLERRGDLWEVIAIQHDGSYEVRKVGTRFEDINQWHLNPGSDHSAEWTEATDVEDRLLSMIRALAERDPA